jgi:hypothetical protein
LPSQGPPLSLERISLRSVRGQGADRAILIGGSGSGKSTLADYLGEDWDRRYADRRGKRLILDRKPRYRAEFTPDGSRRAAERRYRHWDHGAFVQGSVLVEEPADLDLVWSLGHRVAIVQGDSDADIPRMLRVVEHFYRKGRARHPQLLQVDEGLLFFGPTGQPKGGSDILKSIFIAGRERGTASLFCSQRTKGWPPSILEEANRLYLFRLDFTDDVKRLREMGAPVGPGDIPSRPYEFRYWTKADYHRLYGPYRLVLRKRSHP